MHRSLKPPGAHPLFLFNQYGGLEFAMLRRGNHNGAKFWRPVLLTVIERYRHRHIPKYFRGDAAFAIPALYRVLEAARGGLTHWSSRTGGFAAESAMPAWIERLHVV